MRIDAHGHTMELMRGDALRQMQDMEGYDSLGCELSEAIFKTAAERLTGGESGVKK